MKLEWDPDELIKAEHWNEIARQIEYDLIHRRAIYERAYDTMHCCFKDGRPDESAPSDDFERGVRSAIGLIRHRVHSMNPS